MITAGIPTDRYNSRRGTRRISSQLFADKAREVYYDAHPTPYSSDHGRNFLLYPSMRLKLVGRFHASYLHHAPSYGYSFYVQGISNEITYVEKCMGIYTYETNSISWGTKHNPCLFGHRLCTLNSSSCIVSVKRCTKPRRAKANRVELN